MLHRSRLSSLSGAYACDAFRWSNGQRIVVRNVKRNGSKRVGDGREKRMPTTDLKMERADQDL